MECSGAGLGQFFSTFPEPLVSERRLLSSWETVMSNLNFKSFYHKNLKMSQIFYKGMTLEYLKIQKKVYFDRKYVDLLTNATLMQLN